MPFPMKIQPIDSSLSSEGSVWNDPVKPIMKSRLKRLFERQFPSVLRISSTEKTEQHYDSEPSSVCLTKMVQNFMEENNDKPSAGRNRCNCFNGNCNDSSDDELDFFNGSTETPFPTASGESCEILKSLIPCASVAERNLLAYTAKIVEKSKICKVKEDCRNIVTNGLLALGYDVSVCKSRWEKSPSFPAGEYEYIDVMVEGERLLIDIDFRSEFEIARSTANYRALLQSLPSIFVGKPDRLQQIVAVVSEAAKQSLKNKGLDFPPWRKPEYMKAKWLSPYQRITTKKINENENQSESEPSLITTRTFSEELELRFGEDSGESVPLPANNSGEEEKITVIVSQWKPPAIKPKVPQKGAKVVTGLASALGEKP